MNGSRPSRFARQSKQQPNDVASFTTRTSSKASMAFLHQKKSDTSSRSFASRLSEKQNGFNLSHQGSLAKTRRMMRINGVQAKRDQHSRAATVASIKRIMKKESLSVVPDQLLTIQFKPNEPVEMSQLTECASRSSFLNFSRRIPGSNLPLPNASETGSFLKTKMDGFQRNGRLQMRSSIRQSAHQVYTKMVDTPECARSHQNRRKSISASEVMDSKTPRHRNGGRAVFHDRSSQQSFATASNQDNDQIGEAESIAAHYFGQGTSTWNNSSLSVSIANATTNLPAAADFAKTMKADMESFARWLALEQKKLQSCQESFDKRIREGEASIDSHLSKSVEEATKHGLSIVSWVKKDCESAKKSAKQVAVELEQLSETVDKSSKESYAKVEKLAKETKTHVEAVKAEGQAAQTLYAKAADALKAVQSTADFVKSLFKNQLKAFTPSSAMIGQESSARKAMTPPRSAFHEPSKKSKASKVDTFVIIDDSSELENISPLTVKSRRHLHTLPPVTCKPALGELTNQLKQITLIPELIKKKIFTAASPTADVPLPEVIKTKFVAAPRRTEATPLPETKLVAPSTPTAVPVPAALAPKRRRLTTSGNKASGPPKKKQALLSMNHLTTNPQLNVKSVRKGRRKKRGNIVREIDFSLS